MAVHYLSDNRRFRFQGEKSVVLNQFGDCMYYQQASCYIISIPEVMVKHFCELLICRFPVFRGWVWKGPKIYLVWDYLFKLGAGQSQDPEASSNRFFNILRILWKIKRDGDADYYTVKISLKKRAIDCVPQFKEREVGQHDD